MKVKVLASGSKGNSTYIESDSTKLLIDLGINYISLKKKLEEINVDTNKINGVLITHTHNDHIKGLASFIKKTNAKVYVPITIAEQLSSIIPKANICILDRITKINEIEIELLRTSHDAPGSVGYKINTEEKTLVYITDTGYINERYFNRLKDADIYILESNHDEKMLMDGPYPYYLKQRVIGDEGHLSNRTSGKYLFQWIGNNTKYVILAHLSEKNNTEELAYDTVVEELGEKVENIELMIAKQYESTQLIEV